MRYDACHCVGKDAAQSKHGEEDFIAAVMSWSAGDGQIRSQQMEDRCSIPIGIRGKQTKAMLDTGSSVNCVLESLMDELQLRYLMIAPGNRKVLDVHGHEITVMGELLLPIVIGDVSVWVSCVVTEALPMLVILGGRL